MTLKELHERMNEMVLNGSIAEDTDEVRNIVDLINMEFQNDRDLEDFIKLREQWSIIVNYTNDLRREGARGFMHLSDVNIPSRSTANVITPKSVTYAIELFVAIWTLLYRRYSNTLPKVTGLVPTPLAACHCGPDLQMYTVGTNGIRIEDTLYYISIK